MIRLRPLLEESVLAYAKTEQLQDKNEEFKGFFDVQIDSKYDYHGFHSNESVENGRMYFPFFYVYSTAYICCNDSDKKNYFRTHRVFNPKKDLDILWDIENYNVNNPFILLIKGADDRNIYFRFKSKIERALWTEHLSKEDDFFEYFNI
jgi:RNAse (barnase) inhibitor barstar